MGVLTFLVSDEKQEWFELGKLFLDETVVAALKKTKDPTTALCDYLRTSEYDEVGDEEAASVSKATVAWMQSHPDWRYFTEVDDAFDDVYLAENDEDALEYLDEFPEDAGPIYKKAGSAWPA